MGALFGFGAVIINQVTFPEGKGILRYEKEYRVNTEKDNGDLIQKFRYRAYASIELPNFDSTDETRLNSLLQNLNYYKEQFYVIPRNSVEIRMNCLNFDVVDLTANNKGQIIKLEFKAYSLIDAIPAVFYGEVVSKRLTENGDYRITENDDDRILED